MGKYCVDFEFCLAKSFVYFVYKDCMLTRATPNYKNSYPAVITLRFSRYPNRTLGDHIKKWRLEQGLF